MSAHDHPQRAWYYAKVGTRTYEVFVEDALIGRVSRTAAHGAWRAEQAERDRFVLLHASWLMRAGGREAAAGTLYAEWRRASSFVEQIAERALVAVNVVIEDTHLDSARVVLQGVGEHGFERYALTARQLSELSQLLSAQTTDLYARLIAADAADLAERLSSKR